MQWLVQCFACEGHDLVMWLEKTLAIKRFSRVIAEVLPSLRPGLSRRCRQRIIKSTAAASDSSRCLDALRWCGAGSAWESIVCGNTFSSVFAVFQCRIRDSVPFRDAHVSLPVELGDTPLAYDAVAEDTSCGDAREG